MIQLAVITDEIDNDLAHALDVMAEYGIHHAELRVIGDKNISAMSRDEIAEVGQILEAKGAKAIGIASPFFKTDLPQTGEGVTGPLHGATALGFEDQMALLERCIDAAKTLGAPYVRTFTFWRHGSLTPEIEDRIVDAYAEPARIAEDAGIILLVENEHACYTGTGAEVARLVSRIDSPAVRVVWDPGNALAAGEKPFPSGYEEVKPFAVHVHVKDATVDPNTGETRWTVVGDGEVDWRDQILALKADGYDGFLSLETHFRIDGKAEPASRACLEAMVKMLGES